MRAILAGVFVVFYFIMDTLSHALWGYAALRWQGKRQAKLGAVSGAAPDLLYCVAHCTELAITQGWKGFRNTLHYSRHIWRRDGPPMPEELLRAYDHYYVYTHSLVLLAVIALICYLWRSKIPWLLLPWALHIVMDIFTHERYRTPFLFPLSGWTVDGMSWGRPPILILNFGGLLITYGLMYKKYRALNSSSATSKGPQHHRP